MFERKKGMVGTPSHIVKLIFDLLEVKDGDVVLEPCAGEAPFLKFCNKNGIKGVGIEIEKDICESVKEDIDIINADFLNMDSTEIRENMHPTVAMINPPYSLGSSKDPKVYEISFISHLIDCMGFGGRVAAIIPTSSMTGKTKEIREFKKKILEKHTLEGVITMNPNTFYGVDTQTVIAIFTAWVQNNKESKFIDFREDGYRVLPHIGLLPGEDADEKRKVLLDTWENGIGCIKKQVTYEDEWLYASFYKRGGIPSKEYFEKKAEDYLIFRCISMLKGCEWLFEGQDSFRDFDTCDVPEVNEWRGFKLEDIFEIKGSKMTLDLVNTGKTPLVCSSGNNNGIGGLYQNSPTEDGNVLTVESATIGNVHYQQVPFITSGHVEKLILKKQKMNVFIGLFLAASISFEIEGKYNYGYKLSKKRLKQQSIYLPITDIGYPDYEYMEKYMKNIFSEKWKNLFDNF